MRKTAEKVIFSTIYTVLIALVVTYICHRELEPTPSVNYEKSQDAIAYLSDIQNHTHNHLCNDSNPEYKSSLWIDKDGMVTIHNYTYPPEHPSEMLCYSKYSMEARIIGESWTVFMQRSTKPSSLQVCLYSTPTGGSTNICGVATHPITRGTCTVYNVEFEDGTGGDLRIDNLGVFITRSVDDGMTFDTYEFCIKYGDVKDMSNIVRVATEQDLRNSRRGFELIGEYLKELEEQGNPITLEQVIDILKDCSSK